MTTRCEEPHAGNVNPGEVQKFAELSHAWWDPDGELRTLHAINPLRANYIDIRHPVAACRVLDVGCGGGLLSEALHDRGAQVTGIDVTQTALEAGKQHAQARGINVQYRNTTVEALADEAPPAFDIIVCMELLEHVPDPAAVVNACAHLVRPGGSVFFSTLNRNPKSYALAILGAEYILNWVPRGTHDYRQFIQPAELARWARTADLRPNDLSGLQYRPLTRQFRLSSSDVTVNYLMHAVKCSGV